MGSFQLTFDDFTGGHFMGDKVQNQPANTWTGENIVQNPKGELVPVGATLASTTTKPAGTYTALAVYDHWIVGENAYVFARWTGTSDTSQMIVDKLDYITGGSTTYTVTGKLVGDVAYDAENAQFFYLTDQSVVRKITTAGTDTSVSTVFPTNEALTNVALSGFRLLLWGPTKKRLYYSNAARTTFAVTDYYEFEANIIGVYPRPNDILVITEEGAYSMVGVLGSSITIQRILAVNDVMDGMRDGAISGRSLVFCDSSKVGLIDSRLYELGGSSVVPIATFNTNTFLANLVDAEQIVRVQSVNDGRVCAAWSNGEVFIADKNMVWAFLKSSDGSTTAGANRFCISRFAVNSHNEFFAIAWVDTTALSVKLVRYVHNFPLPCKSGYSFIYSSNVNSSSGATGTVTLAEYWHNKPMNVRDVLAEVVFDDKNKIAVSGNVGIGCTVTPLGVVDTAPADVPNLTTSTQTYTTSNASLTGTPIRTIYRFRTDSAAKGYGVSIQMSVNSVRLRRVIVTCED